MDVRLPNGVILANVPEGARGAKFVSAVCVLLPGGACHIFLGECPGRIGFAEQGTNGFGYDPVFFSPRFKKTFAELTASQKNSISHRGRALKLLLEALRNG